MLPAAALLLLFLTYPLGLGTYLGFTTPRSGAPAVWIGLENFEFCGATTSPASRCSTRSSTPSSRSVIKFGLGLWLALLLNKHLPFKAFFRAVVLLPFIVPTALSAIAFWWIYDSQFSIISWTLVKMGRHRHVHRLPGTAVDGAAVDDRRQHLARRALRRDQRCSRGCRRSRRRTTRRSSLDGARRGSSSAT